MAKKQFEGELEKQGGWYDCPSCNWKHPWEPGKKPCPHRNLNIKRGRPRLEDVDNTLQKIAPWDALGMSRSSWYRRYAVKKL